MGVYDSIEDVEQAVQKLREKGAPIDGISIIGQGLQSETKVSGFVTTGDVVKEGVGTGAFFGGRSEEHTSELQSQSNIVCRLLLETKQKRLRIQAYPQSCGVLRSIILEPRSATAADWLIILTTCSSLIPDAFTPPVDELLIRCHKF